MKKTAILQAPKRCLKIVYIVLLVALLFGGVGCTSAHDSSVHYIAQGTYVFDSPMAPGRSYVILREESFIFMISPLSSFLPSGTYAVEDGNLVLTASCGINYVFLIGYDAIYFVESESASLPAYAHIVEGSRFVLGSPR